MFARLTQHQEQHPCFADDKARGHDRISIRMIKVCYKSLLKPLALFFKRKQNHLANQMHLFFYTQPVY